MAFGRPLCPEVIFNSAAARDRTTGLSKQRDVQAGLKQTLNVPDGKVPVEKAITTPPDKEFFLGDMGTCATKQIVGVFVSLI